MIDPTKLKRAGFIGAASGYFLARMRSDDWPNAQQAVEASALRRLPSVMARRFGLPPDEAEALSRAFIAYEEDVFGSLARFLPEVRFITSPAQSFVSRIREMLGANSPEGRRPEHPLVFARTPAPKGPMSVFGYDYFEDKYGEEKAAKLKLLGYRGLRGGGGGEYAYEVLNFVDGKRNAQQIRDAVSAEFGPVPLEYVVEYLRALESIGVLRQVRPN